MEGCGKEFFIQRTNDLLRLNCGSTYNGNLKLCPKCKRLSKKRDALNVEERE